MTILQTGAVRALPERPNLEFEKKRARKLVRERNSKIKLAEAQLLIAREYGFTSWRKLSQYYKTWRQHESAGFSGWDLSQKNVQDEVARLFASANGVQETHADAKSDSETHLAAPLLQSQLSAIAAFVPRFYGLSNQEIREATITETEAQLIVARLRRFPSWQALQDRIAELARLNTQRVTRGEPDGTAKVNEAIRNRDGALLVQLLRTYPDCFYGPLLTDSLRSGPVWEIIKQFMKVGDPATRDLLVQLTSAGVDVQQHLNSELLAGPFFRIPTEQIRTLLELGADPNWTPPTGASVIEYAVVRYMNGEAVDLVAAHVKPRKAFWLAAGLGDVAAMKTFLNKRGQPNDRARRDRADALMMGVNKELTRAQRPDASDTEILSEAFFIAGLNGRKEAMQLLLDLGVSVDYAPGRFPLLYLAVAHEMVEVAEFLIANSAERDQMSEWQFETVRALSHRMMADVRRHPNAARIHALLSR